MTLLSRAPLFLTLRYPKSLVQLLPFLLQSQQPVCEVLIAKVAASFWINKGVLRLKILPIVHTLKTHERFEFVWLGHLLLLLLSLA